MNIEKYIYQPAPYRKGISGLWYLSGDFGVVDGPEGYTVRKQENRTVISYETEQFRVCSVFTEHPSRMILQQDHCVPYAS